MSEVTYTWQDDFIGFLYVFRTSYPFYLPPAFFDGVDEGAYVPGHIVQQVDGPGIFYCHDLGRCIVGFIDMVLNEREWNMTLKLISSVLAFTLGIFYGRVRKAAYVSPADQILYLEG